MREESWKPGLSDPLVQEYIETHAGPQALEIMRYIAANQPVQGETLMEHFGEEAKEARKILYKLMDCHALEYMRETDARGWETFYWSTDLPEIRLVMLREWEARRRWLEKHIKLEEHHQYYECPKGECRMMFEDAMDLDFECPEHELAMIESPSRAAHYTAELDALRPQPA